MTDEQKQLTLTGLRARLEEDGWHRLAEAIVGGTVSFLAESEKATLDSAIFGFGVLIDGKRVDPLSLKLIRYGPAPTPTVGNR